MYKAKPFLILVLIGLLFTSSFTFAASQAPQIDEELIEILYEYTEHPESWINYLTTTSEEGFGRWLPLLIKNLALKDGFQAKDLIDMNYTTITTTYDWGPAVNKVILDLNEDIDSTSLTTDLFSVESVRIFKDFNFATFTPAEKASEHVADCQVEKIYISNKLGQEATKGQYITLELAVGPTVSETAVLNYDIMTNRNDFVEIYFKVKINPGKTLKTEAGKKLTFYPTDQENYLSNSNDLADLFEHNQAFSHDDIDLLYASYTPEDQTSDLPLIIWLHGAGEGGRNTRINVMGNEVTNLVTEDYQEYFGDKGAYVLAPQAPTMWMDYDGTNTYNNSVEGSNGTSYYTQTLMSLIEDYVANHNIDTDKIYIGGCSNGGYMTVNMILEYPEYFAAAFPICEAYSVNWLDDDKIESIKDLPIWLTHSLDDGIVSIAEGEKVGFTGYNVSRDEEGNAILKDDFSNALYNRLLEAGSENVYYSVFDHVVDTTGQYFDASGNPYQYMGHWSWLYALNNECTQTIDDEEISLFKWLGLQSK